MAKIKFSAEKKPEFINDLREQVKQYFEKNNISRYGNWSIVLKSIVMFILYFAPYILMLTGIINNFSTILLSWIAMGIGMAGLGMVLMHDANHGSYSKNTTINKWLGKSLYLLGGFPANWRFQHNTLHHGFTNIEGHDEDINPVGIIRISPHKPLRKIHKLQHIYVWPLYSLMTLSWVTAKDFKRLYKYKKMDAVLSSKNNYRTLLVDLIITKIIYYLIFLVVPILLLPLAWYWVLSFFLIMHFVCGIILSTIFQTAHVMPTSEFPLPDETGAMDNNWAIHQLLTTSDFSPKSRIFSWFIGGLNYQVVHHLFPNISHVHYRKLSLIVKNTAEKHNLPYHVQPNFIVALQKHYKMLKILGR
jgi:linoleoyl-CoA desaturase